MDFIIDDMEKEYLSKRKRITKSLSEMVEYYINPNTDPRIYSAKEVTFDTGSIYQFRVDYMSFTPENMTCGGIEKGIVKCYEIKSCKEDFQSGHGLNFIGDYNYLVLPHGVYEKIKDRVNHKVGVIEADEKFTNLLVVKKAKKDCRKRSISEILLMMFRSSNRELIKYQREERKNGKRD